MPQEEALTILADVLDQMDFSEETDMARLLGVIKDTYPSVEDFEREFPTLCFSLATGVGKTRLMGAFISYLYISGEIQELLCAGPKHDHLPKTGRGFFASVFAEVRVPRHIAIRPNATDHRYR